VKLSYQLAETIEIRPMRPDDERAVTRLAQLDSAPVPPAPLLLAIEGGELRAVISLATGTAIADPFAHAARLVELLRTQATPRQQRRPKRSGFRRISRTDNRGFRLGLAVRGGP
jgi:hypothetical protein